MSTRSSNAPTHEIFAVTRGGDKDTKSRWQKIGAAWPHKDGDGFNLKLEYLPLNGAEMVIRKYKPKSEVSEGGDA
jgi:hypothetical protein